LSAATTKFNVIRSGGHEFTFYPSLVPRGQYQAIRQNICRPKSVAFFVIITKGIFIASGPGSKYVQKRCLQWTLYIDAAGYSGFSESGRDLSIDMKTAPGINGLQMRHTTPVYGPATWAILLKLLLLPALLSPKAVVRGLNALKVRGATSFVRDVSMTSLSSTALPVGRTGATAAAALRRPFGCGCVLCSRHERLCSR
jgi:hypothetical protein